MKKMMKRLILAGLVLLTGMNGMMAQKAGYYNGTEGKTGVELKSELHNIIKGHVDFSYSDAKYILNYADSDPANTSNVILIYTRRSQSNSTWGSGADDINREHVWAKSHGNFVDIRPMDGDAHNLHPADASVNITRSNYDFDECSATGTLIAEANAYYTSTQFEPQDAAKGEVARTLFYMATRYEGTDGEIDLEMIDQINNYPNPKFGKLSTLLQWNNDFPPTDNERRRNERVFEAQRNRNPFIDNPEFANRIWGAEASPVVSIGNMNMAPEFPDASTVANISATIGSTAGAITSATLYYGSSYNSEDYSSVMTENTGIWTGSADLTHFSPNDFVYYKIVASDGTNSSLLTGSYRIPDNKTITPNATVQGTGTASPIVGSTVTVAGIVTANLDNTFYLQSASTPYSGMCVFDIRRGRLGDSLVVTGRVSEYSTLTEIDNVTYVFNYGHKRNIEPKVLTIGEVNESYEDMLVTFKNVTFLDGDKVIPLTTAANLTFTDGAASMIAYARYNSRISGKVLPSGTVDVTGVISQYNGTYQLLINDISDIKAGFDNEAPIIAGIVVNDKNWIEVSYNEKIEQSSAENLSNYTFSDGLNISGAYLYGGTKVLLLVTGIKQNDYTLTINGVKDLQGNTMSNAVKTFSSAFNDPDGWPVVCVNDTVEALDVSLVKVAVAVNDTLPGSSYILSVQNTPASGNAIINADGTITYETFVVDNPVVRDTIIYRFCNSINSNICGQAKIFVTLNFSTSVKNQDLTRINIFPNPTSELINIRSDRKVSSLEITDLSGKIVIHSKPEKADFSLDVTELKGIYFIKLTMDSGDVMMKKLIKY